MLLPDAEPIPADGVLLHVGVHKTGTTAIQAALADARPELLAAGVLYPGEATAQHRAAMAVLGKPWGWKNRGGAVLDRSHFDDLVRRTRSARGRVAISSEFFCEAPGDVAAQVVDGLGGSDVRVVITLRNLGHLLPSSWQQYLKYGVVTPYESWLRDVFAPPGESKNKTPTFWRRHDHAAVLRRWSEAAGPENVTVLVLENVDRSAQFRAFAQMLAVDPQILVSRMDLTSNRSMTAAEAELLVRLNKRVKKELQWDEYERYVRHGVARGMVEGRQPGPDEPRLHTPDWALDAAAERGAAAVAMIRDLGVTVLGDLDALGCRVTSGPPLPAGAVDVIPVGAGVQAVLSVIEASRGTSSRSLAGQLLRRTRQQARERLRRGSAS